MKKPFHPLFFGIFPILFLYLENINEVFLSETITPFFVVLTASLGLFLILRGILADSKNAALILSSFLVLFFSYGHVAGLIRGNNLESVFASGYVVFPVMLGVFLTISVWTIRTKQNLDKLTKFLNLASIILVGASAIRIGFYYVNSEGSRVLNTNVVEIDFRSSTNNFPDIYYLVFDRYAGENTLSEFYNYDNTDFISYLEEKGFYIASESYSNYQKTGHSLASSLNMEYINYLEDRYGRDSDNFLPIYEKLDDYNVWRFLKNRGYTFIHMGSFWAHTAQNKFADINYNLYPLSEFSQKLYETTAFYPFGIRLNLFDANLLQYDRVNFKFEKLGGIPEIDEPTFVFAHFISPHDPYVFDKEGNYQSRDQINKQSNSEGYIQQVAFINTKIKSLIDKLLSDEENPPIIIIQGDTGPRPQRYLEDSYGFDWRNATPEEIGQKLSILNAIYLPEAKNNLLYSSISPVNTFRVIFNQYFDEDLELLEDKYYIYSFEETPYDFYDATEIVKGLK